WSNHGTIAAQNGGTIQAQGTISNFAEGSLTGGTWKSAAGRTLPLIGGNIATNPATIVLGGANAHFFRDTRTPNTPARLSNHAAAGNFTIQNGRNFTTSGAFSNAGSMAIDATGGASTFTATGAYTQTGGSTTLVGGGTLASTTNTVTLSAGVLQGTGNVTGN